MNKTYPGIPESSSRIVYVKPVRVVDLPDDLREQAEGLDVIWSVHKPDGEQVALVADRALAFRLARDHHAQPCWVC